jgi:hypothetical protein
VIVIILDFRIRLWNDFWLFLVGEIKKYRTRNAAKFYLAYREYDGQNSLDKSCGAQFSRLIGFNLPQFDISPCVLQDTF